MLMNDNVVVDVDVVDVVSGINVGVVFVLMLMQTIT